MPQTQHARPLARRLGEPLLPRPLLRRCRRATAKSEADRLLEQFRLADRGNEPVARSRAAWRSGLMVARAIMHRPATLFLDEPTAGLDPQSRLALWEILGELHADGQTILLTTHYMEEADELCNRLAIIDHGHLLALGAPGRAQADRPAPTPSSPSRPAATSTRWRRCSQAEVPGVQQVDPGRLRPSSSRCAAAKACCRWCSPSPSARLRSLGPLGHRTHARDRVHQPHRKGPARMTRCQHPRRRRPDARRRRRKPARRGARPRSAPCSSATSSSLRKTLKEFIPRTILQPFLLVFVFTYVFPKIGQGVGGQPTRASFSTLLVAGVVGIAIMIQGIQSVVAADGAGVRVHPRDRGPRARADAGVAGRGRRRRSGAR